MKRLFLISLIATLTSCERTESISEVKTASKTSDNLFAKPSVSTTEWMSRISDKRALKDITLPGSHDAGAYRYGGGLAITQSADIASQLAAGSRYLDIRLVYDVSKKDLIIYHGIVSQNLSFKKDVLPVVLDFLERHPSETIFIVVKNENGSNQALWEEEIVKTISANPDKFMTSVDGETKLEAARGRIVLLSRSGLEGITTKFSNIKDNASAFARLNSTPVYFADVYSVSSLFPQDIDKKVQSIKSAIEIARSTEYGADWVIANCNGTGAFAWPVSVASLVNPKVANAIEAAPAQDRFGFFILDFVNSPEGQQAVKACISRNFK